MGDAREPITRPPTHQPPQGQGHSSRQVQQGQGLPPNQPPQGQPPDGVSKRQLAIVQTGIPPGLEYLASANQLFIKQEIEMFEVLSGYETNNKYSIINQMGQRIYFAAENTDCCTRSLCGKYRPFEINVLDPFGRAVINCVRPYKCTLICGVGRCGSVVEVKAGITGEPLGTVIQIYSCCTPTFHLLNASGEVIFIILGPRGGLCCLCAMCGTVVFDILLPDGETNVGQIAKLFSNMFQELYTDADNFGVVFPVDLDPRLKAVLLGAVFNIDFVYFEEKYDRRRY